MPFEMQPNAPTFKDIPEEFTTMESVGAAWDLSRQDTIGMLGYRNYELDMFRGMDSKLMHPDEVNREFPMMKPFSKPTTYAEARYLYENEQRNLELQNKIANGPQDMYTKALNFGAGLVAHMMDPFEFGVGALAGWWVGGLMAETAWGFNIAARAGLHTASKGQIAAPSFGARQAFNAIEAGAGNLIENVIGEGALAYQQGEENQDYDMDAGLRSIIASTIFGTVVGMGIKEGSFRLNRILKGTTKNADLAVARIPVAQAAEGLRPNVEPMVRAIVQETSVDATTHPGKVTYQYSPATPEDINTRPFYVASRSMTEIQAMPVGEGFFGGTTLTDSPAVANAASVRSVDAAQGVFHEVSPGDLRPLNLEQPVPENLRGAFVDALSEITHVGKYVDRATGKELMNMLVNAIDDGVLAPETLTKLQGAIQEAGFNSVLHNGTDVGGIEHTPHNVVEVFDQAKLQSKGYALPDPELRKVPTQAELEKARSYREHWTSDMFVDPDAAERFRQEVLNDAELKMDPIKEVDTLIEDFRQEIADLEKQGLLDAETRAEAEKILNMDQVHEGEMIAIKAAMVCVRK